MNNSVLLIIIQSLQGEFYQDMSTLYVDDNNIKSCVHLHTMVHIAHIYIVVTSNLHEICYVELHVAISNSFMYVCLFTLIVC